MRSIMKMITAMILLTIFFELVSANSNAMNVSSKTNSDYIIIDKLGNADYTSIQEAINDAKEGSTIYINSGTYTDIINIRKKLTIIGENKETTIINPTSDENKYAINLACEDIKISDLSIKNSGQGIYTNAIRITAPNTEIKNCHIFDTPVGIAVMTSGNTIQNCHFWGCNDEGIALLGSSYSDCNENTITNCIFENNCDGIELQYSSKNIIDNCEFFENYHTGIDAIAESNNENIVSNCKIYDNNVNGLYFSASSNNQIIDCTITNNKDGNIIERKDCKNNEIKNSLEKIELKNTIKEKIQLIFKTFNERKTIPNYFTKILSKVLNF